MRTEHVTVGVVAWWRPLGGGHGGVCRTRVRAARPGGGVRHAQLVGRSVLPSETYRPGSAPSGYVTGTTAPFLT
jgi:hypothetical protein